MYYSAVDEADWTLRKKAFARWHRWRAPPPEAWDTLEGEISARSVGQIINGLDPAAGLTLVVDSDGGDPVAALDLYRALRGCPAPITTIARQCFSAAVVIFLAGDNRIASSTSRFLLHPVSADPHGRPTAGALRSAAGALDDMDRQIETLICCRCKRYSGAQLRSEMAAETVLDGHGALLRGLATSVTG